MLEIFLNKSCFSVVCKEGRSKPQEPQRQLPQQSEPEPKLPQKPEPPQQDADDVIEKILLTTSNHGQPMQLDEVLQDENVVSEKISEEPETKRPRHTAAARYLHDITDSNTSQNSEGSNIISVKRQRSRAINQQVMLEQLTSQIQGKQEDLFTKIQTQQQQSDSLMMAQMQSIVMTQTRMMLQGLRELHNPAMGTMPPTPPLMNVMHPTMLTQLIENPNGSGQAYNIEKQKADVETPIINQLDVETPQEPPIRKQLDAEQIISDGFDNSSSTDVQNVQIEILSVIDDTENFDINEFIVQHNNAN